MKKNIVIALTDNERELLRTCVRWYMRHTKKQKKELERRFGDSADTKGQEERLVILENIYKGLS